MIVGIPDVIRIAIVSVEPESRIIAFHVEDIQVAVRVGNVQNVIYTTALQMLSGLYFIRYLKYLNALYQVSLFFRNY